MTAKYLLWNGITLKTYISNTSYKQSQEDALRMRLKIMELLKEENSKDGAISLDALVLASMKRNVTKFVINILI